MTRFLKYLIPVALVILVVAAVVVSASALAEEDGDRLAGPVLAAEPLAAQAVVPGQVHYQGYLLDDTGTPMDGLVDLQFDLYKDSTGGSSLWNQTYNDVDVDQGYFAVMLGPLTAADLKLPAGATTLYVQVSVLPAGGGMVSLPRQPLASAPYSFLSEEAAAAPWDGLTGVPAGFADNVDDVEFQNVVTVAKSGGQFTSIQAAINSINDAATDNRYMVWIGPGHYVEQVTTKPYVYLTGAGQWLTWIESDVSNPDVYPPTEATLLLTDYVHVKGLTVQSTGEGFRNVAILALDGANHTRLQDVIALANGLGDVTYGILLFGANTALRLDNVDGTCYQSASVCVALEVSDGAAVTVHGGHYWSLNGDTAVGIVSRQPDTRVDLFDVTAEAADTAVSAMGLIVNDSAVANVHGGTFEARNAYSDTFGILLYGNGAMEATSVVAFGHSSPNNNHGLSSFESMVGLNGGAYTGWGGVEAIGILSSGAGHLEANNVKANGEEAGVRNDAMRIENSATAMVNGGNFFARGGSDNRGIAVFDTGSLLDVQNAEIQGEGGDGMAGFGVSNEFAGTAYIALSELGGITNALLADGDYTNVQMSKLAGPVGGSGGLDCAGVTNLGTFFAGCP
jgi:pectin methylesterase-like acyl-CoA thioesterase